MTNRTAATAAVLLSLAAAAAPAAGASSVEFVPAVHHSFASVYDRADREMIPLFSPSANAPAAGASSVEFVPAVHHSFASVYDRADREMIPLSSPSAGNVELATAPQAVVRAQTPQSGFDWGDAGIGAAGGVALSLIAVGGAFAVSGRRSRRSTALPS